jgi:hypothetical protein
MNDVIAKMRAELRGVLKASVAAYPGQPRDKWLFDWPSQVILVVNQIFWCQEVEKVRAKGRCLLELSGGAISAAFEPPADKPLVTGRFTVPRSPLMFDAAGHPANRRLQTWPVASRARCAPTMSFKSSS